MKSGRWSVRLFLGLLALAPLAGHAADGVGPSQILIGQTLTLQGGKNEYGAAVRAGVETAIAQINRSGGVGGRKLVFKVLDDGNKPEQAEANARQLVTQDKVFLLFGSIEGGPSTAVMKAAIDLKVPFFGPMAGSPTLREPHQPLVFPVRADSDTGQLHLANVQRQAKEVGIDAVTDLPFKSDISDAQLTAMAQKIATSGAQMVFNHGGAGMYEKLIRQSRQLGVKAAFFGVNSGSTQLARHLGGLAHGMIFAQVMPSPWERKTALTRAYQDAFTKEKPGEAFSYGSLEGYLTARALVEAIKRAGPSPTREGFLAGLRDAELNVEGTKIAYRTGQHAGMSLVDLSIVTSEGRFRH